MTNRGGTVPKTVTAGEIAAIAGVRPSAVSNWKRRYSDFPGEVEDGLYDGTEIVNWLQKEDKKVDLARLGSLKTTFWKWANATRGILDTEQMPEVLLQLFALRAASSERIERLMPIRQLWDELEVSIRDNMGPVQDRLQQLLADSDRELLDALRVSPLLHQLTTEDWHSLVSLVGQLDPHETPWGELADAVVGGFLERYGTKGGVFSSGSGLVDLMLAVLEPLEGTVYDPAFGAGVFLSAAWKNNADLIDRLYGQELVEQSWRVGFLHLVLHNARFEVARGDTLVDDQFRDLRADRIAAEPPFGVQLRYEPGYGDLRWKWGVPRKSSADAMWLQHVAFHLAKGGIGAVVMPPKILFGGPERTIRIGLLEDDLVDAVVQLPPGTLAATSVPPCLLVLRRSKERRERVLFVDARHLGRPERGGMRQFDPSDITLLEETIGAWRRGEPIEEVGFAGSASSEEILDADGVLTPNRFISYDEPVAVIDGEPIVERYERIARGFGDQDWLVDSASQSVASLLDEFRWTEPLSGYETVRLGELLADEPQMGVGREKDSQGEPIPYVMTEAVSKGPPILRLVPETMTFGDVKGRFVRHGDLLLVSRGVERLESIPCAKIEFEGPTAYAQSLIRLRVDEQRADPDYLRLFLSSRRGSAALAAAATGSVISNLRRDALLNVEIQLPDLESQKKIAAALTPVENAILELGEALATLSDLHDTVREGIAAGMLSIEGEGGSDD